ncbi:hypothetical protein LEM8419_00141 [Neolewinella maritima]|uniref:DSBA-like thioredoxin domain-containing protein n=1 Tax=Neolewinella maritima TaxID=1383882 RepID=A0ABN8F488_9BACT|nr:DsbA family oxidoreductase [Neolewinella maritima]CAH0998822.1 hypothetical protein LEM8419_00141 [Neolewinella maritima]
MSDKLKIDIVSDVVCPWCIIGYRRLQRAIADLKLEDQVEIAWQPFELNPQMPAEGQLLEEHLREKYGSTPLDQQTMQQRMTEAGNEVGFTFSYYPEMRMANTFAAHVLLEYAQEHGKQSELQLRLMTAFFSERKDVSQRDVLRQALLEVGLNAEDALARLDDEPARQKVREKQAYWKRLGVNSVPTIVFNRQSAVTGAQPVEVFKQVLNELMAAA